LPLLRGAIETTFERRGTPVPTEIPFALTDRFLLDETKRQQWRGFLLRLQLETDTPDLPEVGKEIAQFIAPLFTTSTNNRKWHGNIGWHE
jgi:hypothetical protein